MQSKFSQKFVKLISVKNKLKLSKIEAKIQLKCSQNAAKFILNAAKMQSKLSKIEAKIQLKCSQNTVKMQSKYSQNAVKIQSFIQKVFSLV